MEPLFKNTTTYNSENYEQFIEFHGKKFAFSYNAYNIIMLFLLLYCIILNIVEKNFIFALLFVALSAFLIIYRIYIPIKRHENIKNNYDENEEEKYTFLFYKSNFEIDKKMFLYFQLYKVFETKDYFYLYINDENAILINKESFEVGSADEFRKFIKKKCLLKYRKHS